MFWFIEILLLIFINSAGGSRLGCLSWRHYVYRCCAWICFGMAGVAGWADASWLIEGANLRGTPVRAGGAVVSPGTQFGVARPEDCRCVTPGSPGCEGAQGRDSAAGQRVATIAGGWRPSGRT